MQEGEEKVANVDFIKGLLTKLLQSKWVNSRKYIGTLVTTLLAILSQGGLDTINISQENMAIIAAVWTFWVALESLIEVAKARFAGKDAVITTTNADGVKTVQTVVYKK